MDESIDFVTRIIPPTETSFMSVRIETWAGPANGYVAEDGTTFYVAEDIITFYVQET